MQKDGNFNLIKERRKIKNISQSELGRIIGSQAMVSRIENGQILPNFQTIYLICKALDLTIEEYFYACYQDGTDITKFRNDLNEKYMSNNMPALEQKYLAIKATNTLTLKDKHQLLMTKASIYHMTFRLASVIDQNSLLKYFDQIMRWELYDIYLLECTLNMIAAEKIKPYVSDILVQYMKTESRAYARDIIIILMIKYLESSIMQRNDVITDWLLLKLSALSIKENSNFKIWILFLSALYKNDLNKITQSYMVTNYLGMTDLEKVFNRIQSAYLK